ncbi:IS3 family transposase [Nocardia brasiliensis]|nr:IS3 family transposase [Nocardia brasiliensis]MBF6129097.1 IS3 family transposase [Nocardia brasiliensis]
MVAELAGRDGLPVALACRVLGVSTSGFYGWCKRGCSARAVADTELTATITEIHTASRRTYGAPRVHAELRLGRDIRVGRKRVARLMRSAGLAGVFRRRKGCTKRDPGTDPHPDLVNRKFTVDGPDRLWCMDVTQHRTGEGWVYCAVVLDAFSRRIVGWSIADHLRAELVCDALDMARWRRKPPAGATVVHSDHGSQYTSWAFGQRLRQGDCWGRWGPSGTASTTAWSKAISAQCNWNCSTPGPGPHVRSWPTRSLNTSKPSTTPSDGTRRLPCSAPSTTNDNTPPLTQQREHRRKPVRETGATSLKDKGPTFDLGASHRGLARQGLMRAWLVKG